MDDLDDLDDFDHFDDWTDSDDADGGDDEDGTDDAFDFDEAETTDDLLGEGDDAEEPDGGDGGAIGAPLPPAERTPPTVSAWEFGTGVAVAGWLLDRHAQKITEGVRAAVPLAHPAAGPPRPAWTRLKGPPFDPDAEPLQIGEPLERSRLRRTLRVHADAGHDLVVEARPTAMRGLVPDTARLKWSRLCFTILHSPLVERLPLWVLFELDNWGFSSARLLPVFVDAGPAGRGYCYVDTPTAAVHVVEWGLERHGLEIADFRWTPP